MLAAATDHVTLNGDQQGNLTGAPDMAKKPKTTDQTPATADTTDNSTQGRFPSVEVKVNKSARIRQLLEEMGMDASPTEVVKKLAAENIKVTPQQVSVAKQRMRQGKGGGSGRSRKTADQATTRPATGNAAPLYLQDLQTLKTLVDRMGKDEVKKVVDTLF